MVLRRVASVVLLCLLAGCSAEPPPAPAAPSFNGTDVTFATTLIPHHQQAVDLAALAVEKAAEGSVKALAQRIEDVREPQIAELSALLEAWGQPAPEDPGLGHGKPGALTEAKIDALRAATGPAFDRGFALAMAEHERDAGRLAEDQLAHGGDPRAKELASRLVQAQQAELAELGALSR